MLMYLCENDKFRNCSNIRLCVNTSVSIIPINLLYGEKAV